MAFRLLSESQHSCRWQGPGGSSSPTLVTSQGPRGGSRWAQYLRAGLGCTQLSPCGARRGEHQAPDPAWDLTPRCSCCAGDCGFSSGKSRTRLEAGQRGELQVRPRGVEGGLWGWAPSPRPAPPRRGPLGGGSSSRLCGAG